MVEHFLLRCRLWPQLKRDSWALALWSFSERGGVSPLALTLSGTALAAGGWCCVSKQRTGG